MDITSAAFWAALGSIILANVLLSGDNAVVIAMAARALPANQQKKAIFYGSAAAIVMRIVLTLLAVKLLAMPYLKLVGGVALVYIGTTLLLENDDEDDAHGTGHTSLMTAIRTILVADLVMSLDNVLAVAAAAHNNTLLLILGLGISIPLIIFGSTMLLKVMDRFPIIITLGAALLGYLAGEMALTDPGVIGLIGPQPEIVPEIAGAIGAVFVVALGTFLKQRAHRAAQAKAS